MDDLLRRRLEKFGKSLDSVLPMNEKFILRENANLSSGGTAINVTECVHPDVQLMCERAARIIGLDICGIDLIHPDITLPCDQGAKIIEVNAGPGLRMHLSPTEGQPQPVADKIIEMLYPQPEDARIPIVAVTGTNGKTTTVRMIHKILAEVHHVCVGLTTTDGIWLGGKQIFKGDTTGPQSSQMVLSDPGVSMAVLEVARGGLLRGGVSYDWSDVAVITNISADHIGQNGIEDLDDLLWIKSLVAERVKEGGTVVLNADDELTLSIRLNPRVQRQKPNFFLISVNARNRELRAHLENGGSACWLENGWIMLSHGGVIEPLISTIDLPITMGGKAEFQIYNVMASLAASAALGTSARAAARVLKQFVPSQENLGRFNLYKVGEAYVILDYAHNTEAINSIGRMVRSFKGYATTAVIGLPGDRSPVLLKETTEKMSDYFDRIILKDDDNLRGRQPGEISNLMKRIIGDRHPKKAVEIFQRETMASARALDQSRAGDIIVLFYENLKAVQSLLMQYDPQPVSEIPPILDANVQRQTESGVADGTKNAYAL